MPLVLRTFPGLVIVGGLAVKILVSVGTAIAGGAPAWMTSVDTLASVAIALGGTLILARALSTIRRRLLWRVRRKLIISYIFIGFVPAILLAVFSLLGGLLLFSNFSSYLVQTRLRAMIDRAEAIAVTTARELQRPGGQEAGAILERRQAAVEQEFPEASLAVVPMDRPCDRTSQATPAESLGRDRGPLVTAGPWAHLDAPLELPAWVACPGFSGFLAYQSDDGRSHLLLRALEFPDTARPGFGVVVDLPLTATVREQLRVETGVELAGVQLLPQVQATLLHGRAPPAEAEPAAASSLPLSSVSFLEFHDWTTGAASTLAVMLRLSIAETYSRLSAAQGLVGDRSVGRGLLIFLVIIGVLFLIIQAAALVAGLALARSITGSVHELFEGTERVRRGDFTHKIAITARDQLGELAESFNSMTASIEDLLRQAAEKKRLEEELRIAHEIQMSLLPQGPLGMPGLSVTAICVPAREVGGDYYDFLRIDDHRLGVLIADVSGKGTSAALYMAELKGLVLALSLSHTSPRALLIAANRIIADHLDARSFITMTYAIVDLQARTMTFARAGHTPLIALPGPADRQTSPPSGPGARRVRILTPDGMVLGLKLDTGGMFERFLEEQTIPIAVGDVYAFFTDGITEAMNESDDCFGEQRLGRLIEQYADLPSDQIQARVLGEIESFVGEAPQHDDMTMILLHIDDLPAPLVAAAAPGVAEVAGGRP